MIPSRAMQAWRVKQLGPPDEALTLETLERPEPGPGQVRIRVAAAALNFADDLLCRGHYQLTPELPFTPGLEVAGTVDTCGAGVKLVPGQRVVAIAALPHGALAEYALADALNAYALPDGLAFACGAAMLIAFQTSHLALHRRGRIRAGETLLVHAGAGGVGSAAIQLGVAAGARVFATAGGPEKLALCRKLGAELAIDYREEDFARAVLDATDGAGADVIYDPVGGDVLDRSRKCVAWEGRILLVGFAGGRIAKLPTNQVLLRNYSVVGVYVGEYSHRERPHLDEVHTDLMRMYQAGQIRPVIHAQLPMSAVPQAIDDLATRRTLGKVVIQPR